jgi:ring-1,2-phenylacetyl-CoA epoxidase subunit PaaA
MDKVCFEEGFHVKHGESILAELMNGSRKEQRLTQAAFDEWWPRILQFFGPTDDQSTHHDFAAETGLKLSTNDELRNAFLNSYMPKARAYGLEIPDEPRIRERNDGTYEVAEDDLDWDEFFQVSKNQYPGGVEQIDKREATQEAVSWVRDVLDETEPGGSGGPTPAAAD